MANARRLLMPIIVFALLTLTACSAAGSMFAQPQTSLPGRHALNSRRYSKRPKVIVL